MMKPGSGVGGGVEGSAMPVLSWERPRIRLVMMVLESILKKILEKCLVSVG